MSDHSVLNVGNDRTCRCAVRHAMSPQLAMVVQVLLVLGQVVRMRASTRVSQAQLELVRWESLM